MDGTIGITTVSQSVRAAVENAASSDGLYFLQHVSHPHDVSIAELGLKDRGENTVSVAGGNLADIDALCLCRRNWLTLRHVLVQEP